MSENEKPIRTVKVKSSDGRSEYTVSEYETFSTCDCAGFMHRGACRHLAVLRPQADKKCASGTLRRPSIKERVLAILEANKGEWIRAQDFAHLGWSFRNRISELRKDGYEIESEIQEGNPCARYRYNGERNYHTVAQQPQEPKPMPTPQKFPLFDNATQV